MGVAGGSNSRDTGDSSNEGTEEEVTTESTANELTHEEVEGELLELDALSREWRRWCRRVRNGERLKPFSPMKADRIMTLRWRHGYGLTTAEVDSLLSESNTLTDKKIDELLSYGSEDDEFEQDEFEQSEFERDELHS